MQDGSQPGAFPQVAQDGSDEPGTVASNRTRRPLVIAIVILLSAMGFAGLMRPDRQAADRPDPLPAAPDFSFELFDGSTFELAAHLSTDGRPVVLNLWASWCVPCRQEMPAFDAVARSLPEVLFVGVAVQDSEAAARRFATEVAVSYPLGFDDTGTLLEHYPTLGLPTTFFITREGSVAFRRIGQLDESGLHDLVIEYLGG